MKKYRAPIFLAAIAALAAAFLYGSGGAVIAEQNNDWREREIADVGSGKSVKVGNLAAGKPFYIVFSTPT